MRRASAAAAALATALAGCATPEPPPAANAIALKNAGFETDPHPERPCALGWDCTMHADPRSFRFFHDERAPASGKRSFCVGAVLEGGGRACFDDFRLESVPELKNPV